MRNFFLFFIATLIPLMGIINPAHAEIWVAKNQWSSEWEKKYSNWIQREVKADFFIKNNIKTDCADAVISLRWIFSRINSLPALSTLDETKQISHLSPFFDSEPSADLWSQDARFMKALRFINQNTSTQSLISDIYPIALNRQNLNHGTLYVHNDKNSGHAEWISELNFNGRSMPITFLSSTVPIATRELLTYPFTIRQWPKTEKNGFFKFKQVIQNNSEVKFSTVQDGYSLEQYSKSSEYKNSIDFDDYVTERLIGQPLNGLFKLQSLTEHLAQRFQAREQSVNEGFKNCYPQKCKTDSEKFYSYSTYARDSAIQLLIIAITELIYSDKYKMNMDDQMAGELVVQWSKLQTDYIINVNTKQMTLGQLVLNWNIKKFSSDPNLPIDVRWGL